MHTVGCFSLHACTWVHTASNNLSGIITVRDAAVESPRDHTNTHVHTRSAAQGMSDTAAWERRRRLGITKGFPLLLQYTCVCECVSIFTRTECLHRSRKIQFVNFYIRLSNMCENPWPLKCIVHPSTSPRTIHHDPSVTHLMRWIIDFLTYQHTVSSHLIQL